MKEYREFTKQLQEGIQFFLSNPKDRWKELATKFVNGFAEDELRRLVNLKTRRKHGLFFTNNVLAKQVLLKLKPKFNNKSLIYDPACGAGNLLISVSNLLGNLEPPMDIENSLLGTDIHQEFIEVTKLRLVISLLLNEKRQQSHSKIAESDNIIRADGFKPNHFYDKATHIFVNPPFNLINVVEDLEWSTGKVSAAAFFIDKIIENTNSGVSINAILPEVLRSGSRYEKWRTMVNRTCSVAKVKLLGQFDKYANVDVFAMQLVKRKKHFITGQENKVNKLKNSHNSQKVEDLFDICVGPVVDNRDEHEGITRGYIVSKGLKGWIVQNHFTKTRKHPGKSFDSPFVTIKRTSRMGDSPRAVATIISMPDSVYVDNHLIILKPKSGNLLDCYAVLKSLKDNRTDDWINEQIRCRHLTVKVVSKIPIWK